MYYLVYKIVNIINQKIYIGVHQTEDLEDGYMGSGKYLIAAQKKHGIENFKKEIICECFSINELYEKEAELVTKDFISREDTYNLTEGGKIGATIEAKREGGRKGVEIQSKNKLGWWSPSARQKIVDTQKKEKSGLHNENIRRKGTECAKSADSIQKQRQKFKEIKHQQGEKNNRFGTMWITNGILNKSIRKDDVIPEGWRKGRIMLA